MTKEQKVEIATINNTSITVSNDLLDRMKEQLLGHELRDFCQAVGLLNTKQEFADKKDSVVPTVRVARTFVVNYWKGKNSKQTDFHNPFVCKSGGVDEEYLNMGPTVTWNDPSFIEAGKRFSLLHQTQRAKVTSRKADNNNQFASKAISLAVVAAWSYSAGLFSTRKNELINLYNLTENVSLDLSSAIQWRHFLKFKELRDSLIQSKSINDEITTADYSKNIKEGLNANIDIMNVISSKLFSKPLRRSLNDLRL